MDSRFEGGGIESPFDPTTHHYMGIGPTSASHRPTRARFPAELPSWKPGPNGVIVVEVAIIGLLISLSAFLLLLGIAVSTIFSEATRDEGDLASDFRPIE